MKKKPVKQKKSAKIAKTSSDDTLVDFLFEIGTMRKLLRIHRQTLLTDDMSDNIATHSYRVALIGWFLAKEEKVDPYKVVMMCLLHDLDEARSGDHNWVHKRYVKVFDDEILEEQLGALPFDDLKEIAQEYHERKSKESIVAKEADKLDQILLLREYESTGNEGAANILRGPNNSEPYRKIHYLTLESAKRIAKKMYDTHPSRWWRDLSTPHRR